jgi:hypothetical protein
MSDAATPTAQRPATPARISSRIGTITLWVAAGALLAAPTVLAFRTGGYTVGLGAETVLIAGGVALGLLGLVAVLAPWPIVPGGLPLAALGALAGLAAWTVASVAWARLETQAANDAHRAVMYAAAFALAVAVMRSPAVRRVTPAVLLLGIVVVAGYALGGRLLPELVPTESVDRAGSRLAQPLTYWNALGMLTASGVLLSIAVAGSGALPRPARSAACAAAAPCGLALFLTYPRGALVALAVGIVALALAWPRPVAGLAAAIGVGSAGLASLAALAFPAVRDVDHTLATRQSQGVAVLAIGLALTAAAGLAFARLEPRVRSAPLRPVRGVRAAIAVGLVVAVAGGGILAARSVERTEDIPTTAGRIATFETNRPAYWEVALESFADHPLNGVGTASFAAEWRRERTEGQLAADAHSLYVETLAELGIVGFLLLAAFVAAIALGVLRLARAAPGDPLVPAAAGVLAALAVHLGLDWDWEMPAVTLPALILAAAALQPREAPIDSSR